MGWRIAACAAALLVTPCALVAQVDGWSLGFSDSAMRGYLDGRLVSISNGSRKMLTVSVDHELLSSGPATLHTGLRLTTKGRTITGPPYIVEYLEVPWMASLRRRAGFGPFVKAGLVTAVRVYCTRNLSRGDNACTHKQMSWWELSWEVGGGLRFPAAEGGAFLLVARFARSISDVQPGDREHDVHRVFTVGFAAELARR